ncbi:DNA-binding transcriptional activator BglJ [Serratia rubidaea]|nr:LuxR C-terminal-related transcriptional regulator [Serratia rubidaea]QPR64278.1 hypothetical protein I6G83_03185 [Serratia rubidaea]CAI1068153.1 DNA-binding transcriptional activator BglJ [Serratia rubidaea]CAI1881420.1 DNA-binding transcriptional activator BglJ [Serratia rubidaea]HAY0638353.1 hypothetical protein [Serratia rubidaea]
MQKVLLVDFTHSMTQTFHYFFNAYYSGRVLYDAMSPPDIGGMIRRRPDVNREIVLFYLSRNMTHSPQQLRIISSFFNVYPDVKGAALVDNNRAVAGRLYRQLPLSVIYQGEPLSDMVRMINRVLQHRKVISERLCSYEEEVRDFLWEERVRLLTLQEKNVMIDVLQGLPLCRIARNHNIKMKTAASHKYNAFRKLGVLRKIDLLQLRIEWF